MNRTALVIAREYSVRIRRRSFIVSTLLSPLLMLGLLVLVGYLTGVRSSQPRSVAVIDRSSEVACRLESSPALQFCVTQSDFESLSSAGRDRDPQPWGILTLEADITDRPQGAELFTFGTPPTPETEAEINSRLKEAIRQVRIERCDTIPLADILVQIEPQVAVSCYTIDSDGQRRRSSGAATMLAAYLFGMLMYMFVTMYGAQVMHGVVEEKSNKVLEIMVCSVKPFELMTGKIIGIAAVALTQLLIWIVFAGAAAGAVQIFSAQQILPQFMISAQTDMWQLALAAGQFILLFAGGYLLYAAMFAAVGSAVDNIQDSHQLQILVTAPLFASFVLMLNTMNDPDGALSFWFSLLPFTSPVIMATRIPYGVPLWQVALCLALLFGTIAAMTHLAGKIYRVGIFMTGKKPTLKEIIKWINYKY